MSGSRRKILRKHGKKSKKKELTFQAAKLDLSVQCQEHMANSFVDQSCRRQLALLIDY